MKKIEDFSSLIDDDVAWRKKEVTNLIFLYDEDNAELILKSCILLIYSHWEGAIKNMSKQYLAYVSNKNISLAELTDNYIAISMKGVIKEIVGSNDSLGMVNELRFIESMRSEYKNKRFKVSKQFLESDRDKSIINTQDNLSYKVLSSLLAVAGLKEKQCLETKKIYIDEKLLGNRNKIAHGNKLDKFSDEFDIDIDLVKRVKSLVFYIIDSLAMDIKEYAENQFFLSKNKENKDKYDSESNMQLKLKIDELAI